MSNQEAIALLRNLEDSLNSYCELNEKGKTAFRMAIEALSQESSEDVISRQAAIDAINQICPIDTEYDCTLLDRVDVRCVLTDLPSAQPEQRWIPFKTRPLTKEEKEEHPEWDGILDCKLPDDGQRILVSVSVRGHESVQYDEFYTDDGSYLDSGYEIGTEATAWMPLPEPYREERTEE